MHPQPVAQLLCKLRQRQTDPLLKQASKMRMEKGLRRNQYRVMVNPVDQKKLKIAQSEIRAQSDQSDRTSPDLKHVSEEDQNGFRSLVVQSQIREINYWGEKMDGKQIWTDGLNAKKSQTNV